MPAARAVSTSLRNRSNGVAHCSCSPPPSEEAEPLFTLAAYTFVAVLGSRRRISRTLGELVVGSSLPARPDVAVERTGDGMEHWQG